jgi:hypothetical protein
VWGVGYRWDASDAAVRTEGAPVTAPDGA